MALTHSDLQNIKDLLRVTIDEDETLLRKSDLSYFPTKDEFYSGMDKMMAELKTVRDEIIIEKKLQIKPSVI